MNSTSMRRGLRVLFASSFTSTESLRFRSTTFILQSYSTATARRTYKLSPSFPNQTAASQSQGPRTKPTPLQQKPTEILFQAKVSNSVNLTGHVHMPVQFQTSADGNTWAATVIKLLESNDSPQLWIPVIFEGELAHSAACHLKEKDCIHISGRLIADPPSLDENHGQSNVQIMAQSLNFVRGYPQTKNISGVAKQEHVSSSSASEKHDINQVPRDLHSKQSKKHDIDQSWKDLLSHPDEWWEVCSTEDNPKGAAFEQKKNSKLLFIDDSTPKWLQEKLESMTFDRKPELKGSSIHASACGNIDLGSLMEPWKDLLDDPKRWWDCRDRKLNGLVNPRYPDFKRKDGSVSLWLNRAPKWFLSKLEGVELDVQIVKSKQEKEHKGDEQWKDVVENPDKWWDNRLKKRNERAPDFKHKETGEALWLNSSPSWVLSKLPPPFKA